MKIPLISKDKKTTKISRVPLKQYLTLAKKIQRKTKVFYYFIFNLDLNYKSSSNSSTKIKINGFSSNYRGRSTVKLTKSSNLNLGLDIEKINEKYQFGGDKHMLNISEEESQIKFNEKIKLLADHCVKFMNGEVNEIKCLDFSSDIFFREKDIEINLKPVEKMKTAENFKSNFNSMGIIK